MNFTANKTTVSIIIGDITQESVDVIVNAANSKLRGGGGVDGAIHSAGGPRIMEECQKIGGCPSGDAVITTGGNLPSRYVIHTVGPIYVTGKKGEPETLKNAYLNSLCLASQNSLRSIAFPSISTGVYGYPIEKASRIALKICLDYLEEHPQDFDSLTFVLFSQRDYDAYEQALKECFPDKYLEAMKSQE
jgi:O-acetyl-ADP-ribose deacetylase (regulator of RNase III)